MILLKLKLGRSYDSPIQNLPLAPISIREKSRELAIAGKALHVLAPAPSATSILILSTFTDCDRLAPTLWLCTCWSPYLQKLFPQKAIELALQFVLDFAQTSFDLPIKLQPPPPPRPHSLWLLPYFMFLRSRTTIFFFSVSIKLLSNCNQRKSSKQRANPEQGLNIKGQRDRKGYHFPL